MTLARATPFLILIVLVLGITLGFLASQDPAPAPTPAGPLEALAPVLRGLAAGSTASQDAGILVGRAMERVLEDPRPLILRALAHEDWAVQWGGLLALPRYGESDPALAKEVARLLRSPTPVVRRSAAGAASYLRDEDFLPLAEGLAELLQDDEVAVRRAALTALARRAATVPERVPVFLQSLADEDAECRAQAARALAQIELQEVLPAAEQPPVAQALVRALDDTAPEVLIYAVMALGRLGPEAAPALPRLLALLESEDPLLRGQAATALGSMGPASLSALGDALRQETGPGAPSLLWALRLMGPPGRPLLREAMVHPAPLVRVLAAQQIWELQDDVGATVRVLIREAEGSGAEAPLVAVRVLGRMGTEAAAAIPVLDRLAGHEDPTLARAAATAAERLRSVTEGD